MSDFRSYALSTDPGLTDDRNERQVLIALVATVVGWLALYAIAFA